MEKEKDINKSRYLDSELYNSLLEVSQKDFETCLDCMVYEAHLENPEEILEKVDVLLGFVCNDENPEFKEKIVEVTVDKLLPILNLRNKEKITQLLSEEYSIILDNLEEIKKDSSPNIKSKCLFGQAILTFPGSDIMDEDTSMDY